MGNTAEARDTSGMEHRRGPEKNRHEGRGQAKNWHETEAETRKNWHETEAETRRNWHETDRELSVEQSAVCQLGGEHSARPKKCDGDFHQVVKDRCHPCVGLDQGKGHDGTPHCASLVSLDCECGCARWVEVLHFGFQFDCQCQLVGDDWGEVHGKCFFEFGC